MTKRVTGHRRNLLSSADWRNEGRSRMAHAECCVGTERQGVDSLRLTGRSPRRRWGSNQDTAHGHRTRPGALETRPQALVPRPHRASIPCGHLRRAQQAPSGARAVLTGPGTHLVIGDAGGRRQPDVELGQAGCNCSYLRYWPAVSVTVVPPANTVGQGRRKRPQSVDFLDDLSRKSRSRDVAPRTFGQESIPTCC